jgi:hypothetical protein
VLLGSSRRRLERLRLYGAKIGLIEFAKLYGFRLSDRNIKIPKAVDAAFAKPRSDH